MHRPLAKCLFRRLAFGIGIAASCLFAGSPLLAADDSAGRSRDALLVEGNWIGYWALADTTQLQLFGIDFESVETHYAELATLRGTIDWSGAERWDPDTGERPAALQAGRLWDLNTSEPKLSFLAGQLAFSGQFDRSREQMSGRWDRNGSSGIWFLATTENFLREFAKLTGEDWLEGISIK